MRGGSLRSRLLLLFTLTLLAAWGVATAIALFDLGEEIDEILDSQLVSFAEHLDSVKIDVLLDPSNRSFEKPATRRGIAAFAVFDGNGDLLLNDGLYGLVSPVFMESRGAHGELRPVDQGRWRMLWLEKDFPGRPGGKCMLVVAQHLGYRDELLWEMLESQLLPWLVAFPLFLFTVSLLLKREFLPLKKVTDSLAGRRPEDAAPIDGDGLPCEIRPFVAALNALFVRVADVLLRERRFTSDAAHELRSPLAGLRVQAEVALMVEDDAEARARALRNLTQGIDKTTRLVEQLLALSRLDSLSSLPEAQPVDWRRIIQEVVDGFEEEANKRRIELCVEYVASPAEKMGHRLLLSTLFRNLLDNALRYSYPGGCVRVVMSKERICVEDDGPGVSPGNLGRLGERFFRLPGQGETGTGLGLSIVKRVSELHGIRVEFAGRLGGGLSVILHIDEGGFTDE